MTKRPPVISPDNDEEETLLTVAEVAGMWRVSKMTVYRLVHAGELPHARIGRSFRLPLSAVRARMATQEVHDSANAEPKAAAS